MAATRATFIVEFPEFTSTQVALVNAKLAAADLEIDREVWGDKADQGQMYLAAHKLALSHYGANAKLVQAPVQPSPHGQTFYGAHFDSLVMQVASGFRVA